MQIIRGGRTRELLVPAGVGISGHMTVELIDARSGIIKSVHDMKNLIVNGGLDAIAGGGGTVQSLAYFCGVGSGNTAPANSQSQLVSQIGARSGALPPGQNNEAGWDESDGYGYYRIRRHFTESQAVGNIAEVGFFTQSSGGIMFSRQLVKDNLGNPTEIAKTNSDLLNITYEIRFYPPDDLVTAFNISDTTYPVTIRATNQNQSSWGSEVPFYLGASDFQSWGPPHSTENNSIPPKDANWNPGGSTATSVNWSSYTVGSFYRDFTIQADPDRYNYDTGIGAVGIRSRNVSMFGIFFTSDKVPKNNTQRLLLNARMSYARV